MAVRTPAGRLVAAFGRPAEMRAMYAPDVEWSISASLTIPCPMRGIDTVSMFNEWVWTAQHRPDCVVTILDECGDEQSSAVRFLYSAHSHLAGRRYENEYTLFARSGPGGITHVFEGLDTAMLLDFLSGQGAGHHFSQLFAGQEAGPQNIGS